MKKVQVFGSNIKYKNIPDLANKVFSNDSVAARRQKAKNLLINANTPKVIYDVETGDIQKVDLGKKPLIIREFMKVRGIKKVEKQKILGLNPGSEYDYANDDAAIILRNKSDPFANDDILRIYYEIVIRIIVSGNDGTAATKSLRMISGYYKGMMGDNHNYIRSGFIIGFEERSPVSFMTNDGVMTNYNIRDQTFIDDAESHDELFENELNPALYFFDHIVNEIMAGFSFCDYVIIDRVKTQSAKSKEDFSLNTMKLLSVKYDNISVNFFDEMIDVCPEDGENCVKHFLKKKYPSIDVDKFFAEYDISKGIDTEHIILFCKKFSIKCIAYDKNLNVINTHKPLKPNKLYQVLIYIAYNNHIYPTNNKFLRIKNNICEKTIYLEQAEINNKFNELMTQRIIPAKINATCICYDEKDGVDIKSYINNNILYYSNDDYKNCYDLLKLFGIEDLIKPTTTRYNVMYILEKLYKVPNCSSFFPQMKVSTMKGFTYVNNSIEYNENDFMTVDKNKHYSYSCSTLPFIQIIDIRQCKISQNVTEIRPENLYYINVEVSSILLPNNNYYDGYHLIYCKNVGLTFDIKIEYECKKICNPFSTLISDYYHKTSNSTLEVQYVKDVMNIWIGKMENGCDSIANKSNIFKFCNKNEAELTNCPTIDYNDEYTFCVNEKLNVNIYTRKIISHQIKNASRRIIYEKLESLNITDYKTQLYQIDTDAITFRKQKCHNDITTSKSYKGWKILKDDINMIKNTNNSEYVRDNNDCDTYISSNKGNVLYEGYAGCGKTHWILNKLIPKLKKDKKSYIVLSPSYTTIKKYRQNKITCGVIQNYQYKELPTEYEYIIIDEIGLCDKDAHDTIYKLHLIGKKIYALGDFNQLLPVGEASQFNTKEYIDILFSHKGEFKNNWRNDFTKEYYNKLINSEIDLMEEIKKHRTENYMDAEAIICKSNTTCDKYNKMVLKKLKLNMGDVGCKVMCKTNDLREYEIYNNFILTITDKDDENITLDSNIKIPIDQFNKKANGEGIFKPAYARTCYNVQGESLQSYYVPDSELKKFNTGREAYTIISRLKTK
ncbi:MAG: AAA family ATPase [Bacteroidota bacterium]